MSENQDKRDKKDEEARSVSPSKDCPPRNVSSNPPINISPISGFLYSGMAASPPQFVSLEQIMSAAKGVTNMVLCHEIAVNQDFQLHKAEPKEDGLEHKVKSIVHAAFWNLLAEELTDDPPRYDQAMVLLRDIKEGLLSFLLPQHTRLSAQIDEVLDIDLIRQQAENGSLDVQHYAVFIISVMGRLCAPVRDQKIRELSEISEIVPLFKGILELMDLMKLDMANFAIQQFRPKIQQHSIEYERSKFQEFLKTQAEMFPGVDSLEFTKKWLEKSYLTLKNNHTANEGAGRMNTISLNAVLTKAYLELLEWDDSLPFPETILIDQVRFHELGEKIFLYVLVGSVHLVTLSLAGPDLQFVASFKEHMKERILVLLQDHTRELQNPAVLEDQLRNVSEQVEKEIAQCLEERGLSSLPAQNLTNLKEQVVLVASSTHRVRTLVRTRVLSFLEEVISSSTASPVQVPPGLSTLQSQLASSAGQFMRLVGHNRAVFQEYYKDIVDTLNSEELSTSETVNK